LSEIVGETIGYIHASPEKGKFDRTIVGKLLNF